MRRNKKPFKRPCKKCEQMFQPEGRFCKYCDNCLSKRVIKANRTRRIKKASYKKLSAYESHSNHSQRGISNFSNITGSPELSDTGRSCSSVTTAGLVSPLTSNAPSSLNMLPPKREEKDLNKIKYSKIV